MANKELMNVLVAARDLVKLDNEFLLSSKGEYLVEATVFHNGTPEDTRKMMDNYPELNRLLNDKEFLETVDTAIEQLKLLDLLED